MCRSACIGQATNRRSAAVDDATGSTRTSAGRLGSATSSAIERVGIERWLQLVVIMPSHGEIRLHAAIVGVAPCP